MAEAKNPLDRADGRNPHREPLGLANCVTEPRLAAALEALLVHHRHGFDLSHIAGVEEALAVLRERILKGDDLPKARREGIGEWLQDLAEVPEIPEAPLPAPEPLELPSGADLVQRLLRG